MEVLDLRSLVPLDTEAILAGVEKTSKVVVVHEATRTCVAGAEVAALIAEEAFEYLDGPVVGVATPDAPIPSPPPLEQAGAAETLIAYGRRAAAAATPQDAAVDAATPQTWRLCRRAGTTSAGHKEGRRIGWRPTRRPAEVDQDKIDTADPVAGDGRWGRRPPSAGGVTVDIGTPSGRGIATEKRDGPAGEAHVG